MEGYFKFLGISGKTLMRSRAEYGMLENFSDVSDTDLDRQVLKTLYSGESYARGSLEKKKDPCSNFYSERKCLPCRSGCEKHMEKIHDLPPCV